ncbi:MAG: PIN domain-containing protein [Chloroflexota bacterium]|nr:PIN domain-containing protein [Chloroflexota bacterium]
MEAVIDTNVVFEGLTARRGACGLIVDAWLAGLFQPCVSTALAYEYADVLGHKLSEASWLALKPVLERMLARTEFVPIYFSWRPTSPDAGDDFVIDCAMNAGAPVVTANVRDFRRARQSLGLAVMTPSEFVMRLERS